MRKITAGAWGVAIALVLGAPLTAAAQEGLEPLAPIAASGQAVVPFFEGWYANADGTYTLSFGYFNRNRDEVFDIPIGPDNFIEPAEFDGVQPTFFRPVSYGGFSARRERGVFAITVPADFRDRDVVWTIRSNGETHRVPGRVTSPAYELSTQPMAMGSVPPSVMVEPNGSVGNGPQGIRATRVVQARVGVATELTSWAADDKSSRESEPVPLGVTWWKHQGPGDVTFEPRTGSIAVGTDGETKTMATFSAPGDYLVRVRVDNHRARDSNPADQCCWTNGYLRVTVTP